MLFGPKDPVSIAQKLIARGTTTQAELGSVLMQITSKKLWRGRQDGDGQTFGSFAEFAITDPPYGLGVRAQEAMDALGRHLHSQKLYRPWEEVLTATTRSRGRPRKNLADGENKFPTFKLPTSHTARARQIMVLARDHPEVFEELCSGMIALPDAARKARFIKRRGPRHLRFGVLDRQGVGNLSVMAQGKLLCELFRAVPIQAQCRLLANILGPALGSELASKWRAHMRSSMNPE